MTHRVVVEIEGTAEEKRWWKWPETKKEAEIMSEYPNDIISYIDSSPADLSLLLSPDSPDDTRLLVDLHKSFINSLVNISSCHACAIDVPV
jgi:hypothetical protein